MATASNSRILRKITLLIIICLFSFPTQAKYSGGTGEPNDPYQIATSEDLMLLGDSPEDYGKHFILTADIDLDPNLPGRKVFDNAVIAPDGDTPFTGEFDGKDHTITNMTIEGGWYLGLFGKLSSEAEIKSLGVTNVNIAGSYYYIGGLVGMNDYGNVTDCYSTGEISGSREDVGGLVGANCGGVTNCYSASKVRGDGSVGGLVGANHVWYGRGDRWPYGGLVTRCYSNGTVSGEEDVGGLVGVSCGRITNCYSTSSVTGGNSLGGLVGATYVVWNNLGAARSASGLVAQCYSTGAVTGGGEDVGGLVGKKGWDESISLSFWDIETSGQIISDGGTGKTTTEMQTASTFLDAGWDFVDETTNGTDDIWKISEGLGYPRLSWQKYSGGTGEPNDPYQIATADDLIALGETPGDYGKCFILTADIDLDPNLPGRKVFDKAVFGTFMGVFDGGGHTISHLTIKGTHLVGLFGYLDYTAEVKDLGVVDVNITGPGNYVGGLVGSNGGIVAHCYSTGVVSGDSHVGGLVGGNRGTLTHCYSTSTVSGAGSVGGLVGFNYNGRIATSNSSGSVSGSEHVGGLVGTSSGEVTDCYSTSTVSGDISVGGLVGENWLHRTKDTFIRGLVARCYSTGTVSGSEHVGGLVGTNPGKVTNCYSTSTVGGDTCIGGLVGSNGVYVSSSNPGFLDGLVTLCYSTGAVIGTEDNVGGLVGLNRMSESEQGIVVDSFWDTQTSGQATSAGGTGKTTAEMRAAKTFLDAGWDFVGETANGTEDVWKIAEGLDYPRLWWEPYDGRVTVVLGQIFTVTLESNPSTGYRWEWVDHQDSIVEQIGEAQFKPRETGDPPLVGAGGWESFDFKAVHPGQMTLKLVYRRPWEEGVEPLKTFSLQVTVPQADLTL